MTFEYFFSSPYIYRMVAFALVLFDIDGCGAIVDSKKLCMDGKPHVSGQQGYTKHGRERLRVEILQASGNFWKKKRFLFLRYLKK